MECLYFIRKSFKWNMTLKWSMCLLSFLSFCSTGIRVEALFFCQEKGLLALNNSASFLMFQKSGIDRWRSLGGSIHHATHDRPRVTCWIKKKQTWNMRFYLKSLIDFSQILCRCYYRTCSYSSHNHVRIVWLEVFASVRKLKGWL